MIMSVHYVAKKGWTETDKHDCVKCEHSLTHNKLRVDTKLTHSTRHQQQTSQGFKKEEDIKSGFAMHISFSFRQTCEDYEGYQPSFEQTAR